MGIYLSYSLLLERPWIHVIVSLSSSLHQCFKYIMNGTSVTVNAKKTLTIMQNVTVPYIEAEGSKDTNLRAFEIVEAIKKTSNF